MKPIEFTSNIEDNQIKIPSKFNSKINSGTKKKVRVVIYLDEDKDSEDFKKLSKDQFL